MVFIWPFNNFEHVVLTYQGKKAKKVLLTFVYIIILF